MATVHCHVVMFDKHWSAGLNAVNDTILCCFHELAAYLLAVA